MDLEEKVEKLAERVEKLEEQNDQLKKENRELKQQVGIHQQKSSEDEKVSRRDFLKKLGAGAVGLGALSLSPASAFDIKDSEGLKVYKSGTKYLDASGDPVSITNANLQLDTGQAIEDGSGNRRFRSASNRTWIYDETGGAALEIGSSHGVGFRNGGTIAGSLDFEDNADQSGNVVSMYKPSASESLVFRDEKGDYIGLRYDTSSSSPGTLELKNAELDLSDNVLKSNNDSVKVEGERDGGEIGIAAVNTAPAVNGDTSDAVKFEGRFPAGDGVHDNAGKLTIEKEDDYTGNGNATKHGSANIYTSYDNSYTLGLKVWDNQTVEIPNGNLRLATGQAIEDGGGTKRFDLSSNHTTIRDEDGNGRIEAVNNSRVGFRADSGTPARIRDDEGNFTAVQYDTDSTAGVLRTPNAGIRVEDNGYVASSGSGLDLRYIASNSQSYIRSYDAGNSDYDDLIIESGTLELVSRDGLIDLSDGGTNPADLRLATGQAIEDGSGTERFNIFDGNSTWIENGNGQLTIGTKAGNYGAELRALSGEPVRIRDDPQDQIAVSYSSGNPGTLELTNANLDANGNLLRNVSGIKLPDNDSDGKKWTLGNDGGDDFVLDYGSNRYIEINNGGGTIDFSNVSNNLRLATGQAIEDGGGVDRLELDSSFTQIRNNDGDEAYRAASTFSANYIDVNQPWRVYDWENSHKQIEVSSGNPGTLQLTNANLDASSSDKLSLPQVSGDPTSTSTGDIWYDTSAD